MKKHLISVSALAIFLICLFVFHAKNNTSQKNLIPNDYLWAQRAFPYQSIPSAAYYDAVAWALHQPAARGGGALNWELAGPANVGGRITDLAMHESDLQTIYAATASGGVWKSTDAGKSSAQVFIC